MTTTIECRQLESSTVRNNGDWTTNLARPIEIKQGDSLIINKTFIDTVSQSDSKIIIENDIIVNLTLFSYVTSINHETPATPADEGKAYFSNDPKRVAQHVVNKNYSIYSDGNDYVHCNFKETTNFPPNMKVASVIRIRSEEKNGISVMGSETGTPLIILAFDENGKSTPHQLLIPKRRIPLTGVFEDIPISIITNIDYGLKAYNDDYSWNGNSHESQNVNPDKLEISYSSLGASGGIFTPIPINISVKLDKGSYSASDIVTTLNNSFQNATVDGQITNSPDQFPLNPILIQSDGVGTNDSFWVGTQSGTVGTTTTLTYLENVAGVNWWFGSSLLNLDFNPDSSKFYFKYLHMPMYDIGSSGAIFSSYYEDIGTNKNYYAGKNSGVSINNFSAINNDPLLNNYNEPFDFWVGKMGFNPVDILTTTQLEPQITLNAQDKQFHSFLNYGDGKCTTTGRPVLDALINKSTTPFLVQPYIDEDELIDLTVPAYATNSVLNPIDLLYGYFLIEVQGGFSTEMVGTTNITHNISAIVNRYYSLGSYTSGASDSSLVYTHTSPASLYLNSLNIRILDSTKQVASHLDSDNSLFIQVIPGGN